VVVELDFQGFGSRRSMILRVEIELSIRFYFLFFEIRFKIGESVLRGFRGRRIRISRFWWS
jgi:hypothetical protein